MPSIEPDLGVGDGADAVSVSVSPYLVPSTFPELDELDDVVTEASLAFGDASNAIDGLGGLDAISDTANAVGRPSEPLSFSSLFGPPPWDSSDTPSSDGGVTGRLAEPATEAAIAPHEVIDLRPTPTSSIVRTTSSPSPSPFPTPLQPRRTVHADAPGGLGPLTEVRRVPGVRAPPGRITVEDDFEPPAVIDSIEPIHESHLNLDGWPDCDTLHKALTDLAWQRGFDISKGSHDRNGPAEYQAFNCNRGSYNLHRGDLKKGSQLGCPFKIRATRYRLDGGDTWTNWFVRLKNTSHNHERAPLNTIARRRRQLLQDLKPEVTKKLIVFRERPLQVNKWLQVEQNIVLTPEVFRKYCLDLNKQAQNAATTVEAALELVRDQPGWIYQSYINPDNDSLCGLFLSCKTARALSYLYGSVLTVDATYKTNTFGYPLVQVCGKSCFNKTFTIAVGFMPQENTKW